MTDSININVAGADGKPLASHDTTTAIGRQPGPVAMQAAAGQQTAPIDSRTGHAAQNMASTRIDNDLAQSFDKDVAMSPDLLVRDNDAFQGKDKDQDKDTDNEKDGRRNAHALEDGQISEVAAQGIEGGVQSGVAAALPDDAATLALSQNDKDHDKGAAQLPNDGGGLSGGQIAGIVGVGVAALAAGGGGGGGNSSPAPVGQAAPAAPSAAATPHAAPGKSLNDGDLTNDGQPTFTGTGTAGDTVKLYVDGQAVGTTTVAGDGTFSVAPTSSLGDGSHVISYTFANAGGESASSPAMTIVVDTIAPTATAAITDVSDDFGITTGAVASGGSTDDTSPTLYGSLTGTLGVNEVVKVFIDGASVGHDAVVDGSSWSFTDTTNLTPGTHHSYTAAVVDALGQVGAVSSAWTLDVTAPESTNAVSITSLIDHTTPISGVLAAEASFDDPRPSLIGTLTTTLNSGEHVGVYVDGQWVSDAVTTDTAWTWTAPSDLAPGAHVFTAEVMTAQDLAVPGTRSADFAVTQVASGTTGGNGNDQLLADNTGQVLVGGAGDDRMIGGTGDDTMLGGAGADEHHGGQGGFDTVSYADSTSYVMVDLTNPNGAGNYGDAYMDTYANIDQIVGTNFDDFMWAHPNLGIHLAGGAGDDYLMGGLDIDYLDGGPGADQLDGYGGSMNYAVFQSSATGVTVDLENYAANTGDAVGDTYNSIQGLIGGSGDDNFAGSGYNNTLAGGQGNDTLTGRGGADTFVVRLIAGDGNDTVTDFTGVPNSNTSDKLLITNVLDTGAAGYTSDDFIAAGYDVTTATFGSDGFVRIHLTADGLDASRDTTVTFTGAAATFGASVDSLLASGIIAAQAQGI